MSDWQPIETAPKDGTVVWLRNKLMEKPALGRWGDWYPGWTNRPKLTWVTEYTPDDFFPIPANKPIEPEEWKPREETK